MARQKIAPDHTAVRTALWRALHVQIDLAPHVFTDVIGAKIVNEKDWQNRPDMNPDFSKSMRASIVGRARLVEDLVEEEVKRGTAQYVMLGAGLDTFAQRRADIASKIEVFEIDQPGPQEWKQKRLTESGFTKPDWLHFVPVDFEAGQSWMDQLIRAGFDKTKPAIVVSTGVSMYLTGDANRATLQQIAQIASGSVFAMTFMLALDLLDEKERSTMEFVMAKAKESGTPFLSLFSPNAVLQMAKDAGFKSAEYVSANDIFQKYFSARTDQLRAGQAEAFLFARA